jgi:hypothetical protein
MTGFRRRLPHLIVVLIVFMSCSSVPPRRDVLIREAEKIKLPAYPTKKSAVVYVIRPGGVGDRYAWDVLVDDPVNGKNLAGSNMGGEYIYFYLSSGGHRIYSSADNGAWIDIGAVSGQAYFIEQTAVEGIARGIISMRFVDIYTGKWWTKKLKQGTVRRKYY